MGDIPREKKSIIMSLKRQRFDQINVIPFIDIMLVLLVIVLTTATFMQNSIEVDVPSSKSAKSKVVKEQKEIVIASDNTIYVDDKEVSIESLESIIQQGDVEQKYLIRGDKKSNFESFIGIIDLFKRNDIKNVSIVTKQ
jgi:biopolymer transport protein ExbD